jgi:hypothetical protein
MRRIKNALLPLLLLGLVYSAGALGSKSPLLAVEIEGNIPLILQVSVGESRDATLLLSGIVGPDASIESGSSNHAFFPIQGNLRVNIGSLKIFSNYPGNYSISISSQNGGLLTRDHGDAGMGVQYDLMLNGRSLHSESGLFEYEMRGKSDGGGSYVSLDAWIGDLPEALQNGRYSDRLVFSLTVR